MKRPTPKPTRAAIDALAERSSDAYSFDRYDSWRACAALLLRRGHTEREAEAVLRSKHMRWAGDASNARYGRVTSADLARYIARYKGWEREVADLVAGTFGEAP
jgi:hypothetical protein